MSGRSFQELEVWKRGKRLRVKVFEVVGEFPGDEKFRLSDQLIRSSRSICANIAEGHGRYHFQENSQFCRIARGSLSETWDHLITAQECAYISQNELDEFSLEIEETLKLLNGYINYLQNQKKSRNP